MRVYRSGSQWVVHSPGKLNLFFEVLGEREDGYHEIETLVYPIDLYDTLYFKEDSTGRVTIGCETTVGLRWTSGLGSSRLPTGADNLAVRAVLLLRRRAGVRHGARMRLVKRIPSAAGLGGGSSDAAAALVAANRCWRLGWSRSELARVGAEVGSDVPLFLAQGPAVCRGRGERVEVVCGVGMLHFVVVRPPGGLSTAEVYRACGPIGDRRRLQPLIDALTRGHLARAGSLFFNRLQPAASTLSPWIDQLRGRFERLDVWGHQMTGSGTCYFGLCRHGRQARRLASTFQARGWTAWAVRGCR